MLAQKDNRGAIFCYLSLPPVTNVDHPSHPPLPHQRNPPGGLPSPSGQLNRFDPLRFTRSCLMTRCVTSLEHPPYRFLTRGPQDLLRLEGSEDLEFVLLFVPGVREADERTVFYLYILVRPLPRCFWLIPETIRCGR